MSSGVPSALAHRSISRNFSRAVHVVAATCLVGAAVITLAFQAFLPHLLIWPAIIALAPIVAGLFLAERFRTVGFCILYLTLGAASVYAFALIFQSEVPQSALARAVTVELPQIALIMVGSTGAGSINALRWSIAGFLIAELAASAARIQLGLPLRVDGITAGAFAIVVLLLVLDYLNWRRASRTHPQFTRAAKDEMVAAHRYRIEVRAAALMHDTVLNHLAAIAATTSSTLPLALIEQMARDLDTLTTREWLETAESAGHSDADWRASPLGVAVREAEALGLEIGMTGETESLIRLDGQRAAQLALAVKQCLVNVLRHSGSIHAELAVHGADDELLVMVVDTGKGFDIASLAPDRLGIRNSIVSRIEGVGGSVQVWSTPGHGTSVVMRLPIVDTRRAQSMRGGAS